MINTAINMNRQEGKNQAQLLKGKMKWAITHHLEKAAQFHRPPGVAMELQCVVKLVEGWCDMEKNKLLEQTETGAADRGDLFKRKMFKHMLQREFSDIPGGYGLPIKEAEEKVKKLERRAQAETGAADRREKRRKQKQEQQTVG
jgi:hypothetical protein